MNYFIISWKSLLRNFTFLLAILFIISCGSKAPKVTDSDWPQYKKDNYRSASSNLELDLKTQGEAWVHKASQQPAPAWFGPAKEDAYANSGPLPSMRDYDLAFYPIVVGSYLYYGSSADDALHCLDANTGKEKWLYTTDGPIRIAPTYFEGNLYFGSDDGNIYSLNAVDGELNWKYSPSPKGHQKVLNNGRLISFWPIRTGILIEDGIAYFGASLLPWKKSYICAVDIDNGKLNKPGTYVKVYKEQYMTLEGSMASTGSMLIQPQGRISPVFIDKSNGEKKSNDFNGNGGCFLLVTPDQKIAQAKTSKNEILEVLPIEKQPEFMTIKDGKEMLVKGDTSFVLNENSIAAYHRKTKKLIWLRRNYLAHRIVIAGNTLFAGGTDKVYGINIDNGLPLWEAKVDGAIYAMVVANNALYASTGEGKIYCFTEGNDTTSYYAENLNTKPGIDEIETESKKPIAKSVLQLRVGPFVRAMSRDSVLLEFETNEKVKVDIEWKTLGMEYNVIGIKKLFKHRFTLPIRKDFNYNYALTSSKGEVAQFEYDNFFNYSPRENRQLGFPEINKHARKEVEEFLFNFPQKKGFCIVLGDGSEDNGIELAIKTDLKVVKIETSKNDVDFLRNKLQEEGIYGSKISVLKVDDINEIPIISEIADLVWVNEGDEFLADEIIRLIAPNQHAIVNGVEDVNEWLFESTLDWQVKIEKLNDNFVLTKNPIEYAGKWTHEYGRADNSSFGGESLWGASSTEDFEVQWMGRPGPRFQTDRNGRKPAPLAVSGKMFVQGNQRVIALNVYNGTVLWSKDFPGLVRMNVVRDCSNWSADNDNLYMVIEENLLVVNQQNGEIVSVIPVEQFHKGSCDWSYISVQDSILIGSTVPKGSKFTNYHGNVGWYDKKSGPLSYKVLSNKIFASTKTGKGIWEYIPKGAIVNPTITIFENYVSFVETRSPNRNSLQTGRGGDEIFNNTWIVSLDKNSGKKIWERRFRITPGRTSFYMAAGKGKYVIVSSNKGIYDIQTYIAKDGKAAWKTIQNWFHGDHGAHMSKPAIVGNRLIIKPAIYNLTTGEQTAFNVPKAGHGCAHYALSEQSLFYRGHSVTQFNFDTRNFSKWERLRPDCWLSTIPAEGMILSPEAGGGCSCGNWLETSIVMAPISRAPITIKGVSEVSKLDYKNESWGEFASTCNFSEFKESLEIQLSVKPGVVGNVFYTIDGSDPNKSSKKYTKPFIINETSEIKASIYLNKKGKERRFIRKQKFLKVDDNEVIVQNN